jgi:hypothetical protein
MMSFSNATETALLNYLGPGTNPSWHGQTTFYYAAHTADPGDTGTATSSEVSGVGSYARVAVTRATGLSVSGNQLTNVGLVQFPIGTSGGPVTITHITLCDTATGAGDILFRCELTDTIPYQTGIQPQIANGALTFTLD